MLTCLAENECIKFIFSYKLLTQSIFPSNKQVAVCYKNIFEYFLVLIDFNTKNSHQRQAVISSIFSFLIYFYRLSNKLIIFLDRFDIFIYFLSNSDVFQSGYWEIQQLTEIENCQIMRQIFFFFLLGYLILLQVVYHLSFFFFFQMLNKDGR